MDTPIIYDATGSFEIHAEIGRVEQFTNYFTYTYIHFKSINEKHFKIGLVPKEKGIFCSGTSLASIYGKNENKDDEGKGNPPLTNTECKERWAFETHMPANNGNINYYLIDGVCHWSTDSLEFCYDSYDKAKKGVYAFVVE